MVLSDKSQPARQARQGSIVWAEVEDSEGRRAKYARPVVVLTPDREIPGAEILFGVGVSSTCYESGASRRLVELPWHPNGHPHTGLRKRCHAVCDWIVPLRAEHVREVRGQVGRKWLIEILRMVGDLPS